MQNSMSAYRDGSGISRTHTVSLRSIVIFLTGVMTMVHMVTLFSYVLYVAVICALLFATVLILLSGGIRFARNVKAYLSWYGALYVLILLSLFYTVNHINPDFVIKRCSVIFLLGLITSALVRREKDFVTLANGLITGTMIVIAICLMNEGARIGIGRIGQKTVGSAVTLSGIALVGYTCAIWRCVFRRKHRVLYGLLSAMILATIIMTGARRPLMISVMNVLLLVLFNKGIKKSTRALLAFVILLLICVFIYLLFTNDVLYSMIGWRIESMINTFLGIENTAEDASMLERSIMKAYGYELFRERPLFGYGVHGFAYKFYNYYGKLLYSHCGFSELLSCYGIAGFLLFYRIYILYARKGRKVLRGKRDIQTVLVIYAALSFIGEMYSMAFITPQSIVMLTAGANMLRVSAERNG